MILIRNILTGCLLWFGGTFAVAVNAAELFVVEEDFCPYCKKFHAEIAEAYPNTDEGKCAPLRILQLGEPFPAPYQQLKAATVTPTFILVDDDQEVDRLVGYPGDEHFWFLLGEMLEKLDESLCFPN